MLWMNHRLNDRLLAVVAQNMLPVLLCLVDKNYMWFRYMVKLYVFV